MSFMKLAMKVVQWTATIRMQFIVSAAAIVFVLPAADAQKKIAAKCAAMSIKTAAAAAPIHSPKDAKNQFVRSTDIITNLVTAEKWSCASGVTLRLVAITAGPPLAELYQNHLLNMRRMMSEGDYLSDIDKIVLEGIKLGVFNDTFGRHLLNLYHHGIMDTFVVHNITERVRKAQRRIAFSGCPLRVPELHHGDYVFGHDIYDREIKDYRQSANAHTMILGTPGCGKSNISKHRAVEIVAKSGKKIYCCLIDFRKKEYRLLRRVFAQYDIDLKIIRGRRLKINPLEVPFGVEPIEYASIAADFIVKSLNLPQRASTLVRSTILKLYMHFGIMNGGEQYPTCFHLFLAIKADRDANAQARQSVLDNLESLLLACGPEMLAYHRGWSVHELARQHIVIELAGLPEMSKDLITAYFLAAEFSSRIAQNLSNCPLSWYIAADECQRIFAKDKESSDHEGNALIDQIGLIRGAGVSFEASVLTTTNLSSTLPALTSTKIIGRLGSMPEYNTAGGFIALNSEQTMWAAHHLRPGLFVGQFSEGDFRYPFVFSVPLLENPVEGSDYVSDDEADRTIESLSKMKLLPASGI